MKHTVAIPSYRRPDDLRRALEALRLQERPAEEVLVLARREDQETQRVAAEYGGRLPVALELVDGPGVITPLNRALDVASGDILTFIDDDAAPYPDWSRRIMEVFEAEPDLAGLGGRDQIQPDGWRPDPKYVVGKVHWYGRVDGNHQVGAGARRDVDLLKGVNMSLRRSALGALRIDTRLRGNGAQWHWELNLCLGLRSQGKRLAYDPAILVDHFPSSPRFDEDARGTFNALAYENQIFNLTYSLLGYLGPVGRMLLLSYALLIGIRNNYCGALKTVLYCPRIGVGRAWAKGRASARGVCAAWRARRAEQQAAGVAVEGLSS